jgi:acyl-CoA-dependent ceramide synthase
MVFYWIVVFTGLRAAVMDYLLTPFAKKAGAKGERDQTRFAEQAWLLVYYSVFWTLGLVRGVPTQNLPRLTKVVHSGQL